MGKPSRTRDFMGALLLVLVGLLYMTGVSDMPLDRGADAAPAPDVTGVSVPVAVDAHLDIRT